MDRRRYTRPVKTKVSVLVGPALLVIGLAGCDPKPAQVETPAASSSVSNAPVAVVIATNEFAVLKGRWQRGDGGYVIEIRSANLDGKLEAGYFNPKSINVSQAQATHKDGSLVVFVELRDANYPGSTYQLTYDAKTDQLFGTYYQAAIKERFDVAFGRAR